MAAAKPNKKTESAMIRLRECPVCLEVMTAPIYQCVTGHSLCSTCTKTLVPFICPICREQMEYKRNLALEELINEAVVPCPNKKNGCIYTKPMAQMAEHLKECIFREMECPLAIMGKCSWKDTLTNMMQHFKERHPDNCNVSSEAEVTIKNINLKEDERKMYLFVQGKIHFIITFKLDTLQEMAYWTFQLIGSKEMAQQHVFEIHVTSLKDARRKVTFTEHCFNDAIKAEEIFRLGKCPMISLDALEHFVKDKKLTFRFFVKQFTAGPGKKQEKKDGPDGDNTPKKGNFNKGPGPKPKNGPKKAQKA